jgi:hypothetical protein
MNEIAKLLDALTPRQFEQLLYEAEKRGLVSRRAHKAWTVVGESESKECKE